MMEVMSDRIEELEVSNKALKEISQHLEQENLRLSTAMSDLQLMALKEVGVKMSGSMADYSPGEGLFSKYDRDTLNKIKEDPEQLLQLIFKLKAENHDLERMVETITLEMQKLCAVN